MTVSEAQLRAIKKYRQGNGLMKSRETQQKRNDVRNEFTRLCHLLKAF